MTHRTARQSGRKCLAAGLVLCTVLLLTASGTAAEPHGNKGQHNRGNPHGAYSQRGRGGHYNGGYYNRGYYNGRSYYRAPPLVYGSPYYQPYASPYYYPPPVVYGPDIGISIGIR